MNLFIFYRLRHLSRVVCVPPRQEAPSVQLHNLPPVEFLLRYLDNNLYCRDPPAVHLARAHAESDYNKITKELEHASLQG